MDEGRLCVLLGSFSKWDSSPFIHDGGSTAVHFTAANLLVRSSFLLPLSCISAGKVMQLAYQAVVGLFLQSVAFFSHPETRRETPFCKITESNPAYFQKIKQIKERKTFSFFRF